MDVLVGALEQLIDGPSRAAAARRRARRRRRSSAPGLPPRGRRPGRPARPGERGRTRRACCAASTSTARPNTGQESFGVILLEAMAARTPIVASDIEAFRRVLRRRPRPVGCSPSATPPTWPSPLADLLDDPDRRAELVAGGRAAVAPYDWAVVGRAGAARLRTGDRRRPGPADAPAPRRPGRFGAVRVGPCSPSAGSSLAVLVAILLTMWVTFTLTRLDRLHARVDAAQAALDAQLVRRAAALLHVAEAAGDRAAERIGPREYEEWSLDGTGRRARPSAPGGRERGGSGGGRARRGAATALTGAAAGRAGRGGRPGPDRPAVLQRRRPRHPCAAGAADAAAAAPGRASSTAAVLRHRRHRPAGTEASADDTDRSRTTDRRDRPTRIADPAADRP